MTSQMSLQEIAEELRSVDDKVRGVVDNLACLGEYMTLHAGTISEKGVDLTERTPKFAEFCSRLYSRSKKETAERINMFDHELMAFRTFIAGLSETSAAIEEASKVELSITAVAMKAASTSYDNIIGQMHGAMLMGKKLDKAEYTKTIEMAIKIIEDKPIDETQLSDEVKRFHEIYQKANDLDKTTLKARFLKLAELFACIVYLKRCPTAINGRVCPFAHYIPEFPVNLLLTYLQVDKRALVLGELQ